MILALYMLCLPAGELARADGGWSDTYRIGAGDTLRVAVFDEPDLSGAFAVAPDGTVNLPLIGNTRVAAHTLEQATTVIEGALRDGYLKNPAVTLAVVSYRPFYIMGAVDDPGEYPYRDGLTVLQAVAMGGGTDTDAPQPVSIVRICGGVEMTQDVDGAARVLPGDVIRVGQAVAPQPEPRRYHYD